MKVIHRGTGLFQVRKALLVDANAIQACLRVAFEKYRTSYTRDAFADTVPDLIGIRRRMTEMTILVAVSASGIVGTLAYRADGAEGHLRGMAVLPVWQGTGVAPGLLLSAESELRRLGCSYVTLDTTDPLQRAIGFYRRHGFSPTGKVSEFFGMPLHEFSKLLCDGSY